MKLKKFAIPFIFVALVLASATYSLASVISAPAVKSFSPAAGSVQTATKADISFEISDPDGIANNGYYIKLDGTTIATTFEYTSGYWEYYSDG